MQTQLVSPSPSRLQNPKHIRVRGQRARVGLEPAIMHRRLRNRSDLIKKNARVTQPLR